MSTEHQMQYTFDYFLNALYVDIIKRFIGSKHKNAAECSNIAYFYLDLMNVVPSQKTKTKTI